MFTSVAQLEAAIAPADSLHTTLAQPFADYSFRVAAHSFKVAFISFFDTEDRLAHGQWCRAARVNSAAAITSATVNGRQFVESRVAPACSTARSRPETHS